MRREISRANDCGLPIIAILVSRVEALCLASMLEDNGILVHIDGLNHASVEFISLGLGGHRIRVVAADFERASALIREAGIAESWEFSLAHRRAVIRVLGLWTGLQAATAITVILFGVMSLSSLSSLLLLPLSVLTMPVNPQGRGDYFLSAAADVAD